MKKSTKNSEELFNPHQTKALNQYQLILPKLKNMTNSKITNLKLFFLLVTCSFIHNISLGQSAPTLGTASGFALFTATGAFSNTGAATNVTGDVGTNVGAFTAFPPGTLVGTKHVADPASATAATDVDAAYSYLFGLTCGSVIGVTLGNNQILTPNVYCIGAASTLNGDLILDAQGDPNALFIFKIDGALSTSTFSNVKLTNSASLCNVYWQINGAFALGDSSVFRGTIVANGQIELLEGSSLLGRGFTKAGAILLHNNIVAIGMQPTASITTGGSTTICSGNPITLTATAANGAGQFAYLWSPGGQTTASITSSPIVTTPYSVVVTAANGCSGGMDTLIININPNETASAGADQNFCPGVGITLAGSISGSATSGIWSGGTGTFSPNNTTLNAVYTPSTADIAKGSIVLTLTTIGGTCTISDQMTINVNPFVNLGPDTTIFGCILLYAGNPGSTFNWSTGDNYSTLTVCTTGKYWVTVSNGTCIATDSITITVTPTHVNLGNDTTFTGSITLNAGNPGATFLWSTGSTTQTITVNTPGTYYVTVSNVLGSSSDTVNITIKTLTGINETSSKQNFNIYPNPTTGIFTFKIGETKNANLKVTNMLGETIYSEQVNSQSTTINIKDAPNGIYLLQLQADGKIYYKKIIKQ